MNVAPGSKGLVIRGYQPFVWRLIGVSTLPMVD